MDLKVHQTQRVSSGFIYGNPGALGGHGMLVWPHNRIWTFSRGTGSYDISTHYMVSFAMGL